MISMLLKTKKSSVACAILWLLASITPTSAAADIPKFRDFAVDIYKGPVAAPNLSSNSQAKTYRTRLRDAAKGEVNFAGHYILTSWGCGTTCVTGAIIDAQNGDVFFLPFSVCCWRNVDDGFQPIEFRKNKHADRFCRPAERARCNGSAFLRLPIWKIYTSKNNRN